MKVSIHWNAGQSATGRALKSVLFGASWSHSPTWPERTTHIYLGLWVLTFVIPSK